VVDSLAARECGTSPDTSPAETGGCRISGFQPHDPTYAHRNQDVPRTPLPADAGPGRRPALRAQRDALARATPRARRSPPAAAARLPAAALTRRLRTVLGAGNPARVAPRARRVRAGAHGLVAGEIYQVHKAPDHPPQAAKPTFRR